MRRSRVVGFWGQHSVADYVPILREFPLFSFKTKALPFAWNFLVPEHAEGGLRKDLASQGAVFRVGLVDFVGFRHQNFGRKGGYLLRASVGPGNLWERKTQTHFASHHTLCPLRHQNQPSCFDFAFSAC